MILTLAMDQFLPIPGKSVVCILGTINDVTGNTPLERPHMVLKLQRLSFQNGFLGNFVLVKTTVTRKLVTLVKTLWKDPVQEVSL